MAGWFSDGQGELFEEFDSQKSRPYSRKRSLDAETKNESAGKTFSNEKKPVLGLSKEHIIFSAIFVIVIALGSFFAGVEKGKVVAGRFYCQQPKKYSKSGNRILLAKAKKDDMLTLKKPKEVLVTKSVPATLSKQPKTVVQKNKVGGVISPTAIQKIKLDLLQKQLYVIQVVTYRKADLAEAELLSLKQKGFSSFRKKSGDYHVVCVGPFGTKDDASSIHRKLARNYKDCFIKKIE